MNTTINTTPAESRIHAVMAAIGICDAEGNTDDEALYSAFYLALESEPLVVNVDCSPAEEPDYRESGYSPGYPGCPASTDICEATWFGQEVELVAEEIERATEDAWEAVSDRD